MQIIECPRKGHWPYFVPEGQAERDRTCPRCEIDKLRQALPLLQEFYGGRFVDGRTMARTRRLLELFGIGLPVAR